MLLLVSLYQHAVVTTPVGLRSLIAHASCLHGEEAVYSAAAAFPDIQAGRLPHYPFRGLLNVHYALRPAWLAESPRRSFPSKAPTVSLPPPPLRLLPAGATSCRVGVAPTGKTNTSHGALNNLIYGEGMKPLFEFSYYVGTFGEYDLGAVRHALRHSGA